MPPPEINHSHVLIKQYLGQDCLLGLSLRFRIWILQIPLALNSEQKHLLFCLSLIWFMLVAGVVIGFCLGQKEI